MALVLPVISLLIFTIWESYLSPISNLEQAKFSLDLSTLENKRTSLQIDVAGLKEDVSNFKSVKINLKTENADLQEENSSLQSKVEISNSELGKIEKEAMCRETAQSLGDVRGLAFSFASTTTLFNINALTTISKRENYLDDETAKQLRNVASDYWIDRWSVEESWMEDAFDRSIAAQHIARTVVGSIDVNSYFFALCRRRNRCRQILPDLARHSSLKLPLKLSTKPFCIGLPGAM